MQIEASMYPQDVRYNATGPEIIDSLQALAQRDIHI